MMTTHIHFKQTPSKLIITYTKGSIKITITSSPKELLKVYGLTASQICLDSLKMIIKDNKLCILKSYNLDSTVEEWTTINGKFTFKKEDNLIICVNNADTGDYIYLKDKDLKGKNRYKLTSKEYIKLKNIKNAEKAANMILADNINLNFDLSQGLEI